MRSALDPIALLELGYAAQVDSLAWMRAMAAPITQTVNPTTDGAFAYCLSARGAEHVYAVPLAGALSHSRAALALREAHANNSEKAQQALLRGLQCPGIHSAREVVGGVPKTAYLLDGGYVDAPVAVVHPADRPPVVFATLSRQVYRIDAAQRALWRKLAAHLGAGCRLSGRAQRADAPDVECALTPGGRVLHAAGEGRSADARASLRAAVRMVDRARTRRGRSDPAAALELWRGLLCGRWSLVDYFDSDGRRLLLARCNEPDAPGPALPLRQRQVLFYVSVGWSNKEVGYALGIGESTVASHLRRALAALNIMSRTELVRLGAGASSVAEAL